jgi:hypothetical protein
MGASERGDTEAVEYISRSHCTQLVRPERHNAGAVDRTHGPTDGGGCSPSHRSPAGVSAERSTLVASDGSCSKSARRAAGPRLVSLRR